MTSANVRPCTLRPALKIAGATLASVAGIAGTALGLYAWNNITFAKRDRQTVTAAGFTEQTHSLPSGTVINYAEGPRNGPAVLLIHAQSSAWESYSPVLPKLARDFHVYAIDVVGHGSSDRTPGRYDIHTIGADVVAFMAEVIDEPVILSGHSSGGLIAAWVAADAPERVSAVLFEDPPFFSTDANRMPQQFNFVDLARPAHEFLAHDAEGDFVSWYIKHNAWIQYFGGGKDNVVKFARNYRRKHPNRPLNFWFLPPSLNKSVRYMHEFDPRFADAFYTFEWQADFDQQKTLEAIHAPSILIHANWNISGEGILEGAMTDDDAARVCAALPNSRLERVDTGHGFHDADPQLFVDLMHELRTNRPR